MPGNCSVKAKLCISNVTLQIIFNFQSSPQIEYLASAPVQTRGEEDDLRWANAISLSGSSWSQIGRSRKRGEGQCFRFILSQSNPGPSQLMLQVKWFKGSKVETFNNPKHCIGIKSLLEMAIFPYPCEKYAWLRDFLGLLAPQSGALRISAYGDFHPIPSHPSTYSFRAFKPFYSDLRQCM